MIIRPLIAALIFCMSLTGQDLPELPELPRLPEMPALPEIPELPQILELRDYHGKIQGVVVHRLDVKPRATLVMKALRGDVIMQGTDVHRIVIEEEITVKTKDKQWAQEVIDKLKGELRPPASEGEPYIFQVGKWGDRDVSFYYKARVPKTFNVIIHSYGGDIDLAELQGDLEVKTGGGDVALSNASGKIMLGTKGGDIDLFKVEGQIELVSEGGDIEGRHVQGKAKVRTSGGDIDFFNSKGNYDFNTGGGDISLQDLEGSDIEARTGGGEISVQNITAELNLMTGGGDIEIENLRGGLGAASGGGDLTLRRIIGDAVLFTGAGDVWINRITGAVRTKSDNGDIEVREMTLEDPGKSESTFTASHGNVYVNFNTEKPVDITARILGYSPHYAIDYINSNVKLEYSKEDGNTVGTYTTDQPFHRMVIETTEGKIKIRKGEE
ncbi:MAG: DUF4097 domain-containing protein [Candidatus Neomarinimicrobiota bacterium]